MMDMLVKELDTEMTEAQVEEKDSQEDYEKTMTDAANKRAGDSKAITEKTEAKANMEAELQELKDTKKADETQLAAVLEYIQSLHTECDWLLEYYTVRKEARAGEIDALGKAKDVLSGADYSLMQTGVAVKV